MQRIVLRNEDEGMRNSATAAERRVTLFFPGTSAEYEQARAEVETSPPAADEAGSGGRGENELVTAVGEEEAGTAGTPAGGRYVVTSDQQRHAWGLPLLANGAAAQDAAPADRDAAESPGADAVPVVDPSEAIDVLFGNGSNRVGEAAAVNDGGAVAGGGGPTGPSPVVNLKHGRGPIPKHVRALFGELCRQPRIDSLLASIDGFVEPLERSFVPKVEAASRDLAALRRQEVTPEQLGEAIDGDPADERAERIARTCWSIERRLRTVDKVLGRLDFQAMENVQEPSSFRRLLQRVEEDPDGKRPEEGLVATCDQALRGFERAAWEAVNRIRAIGAARREVAPGEWNDAALDRIGRVLQRIDEARQVMDADSLPSEEIEAVRTGLKEEATQAGDRQARAIRDVLGRVEAADLPVEVLARALDEVRLAQAQGSESAADTLERVRVVMDLPWTARAPERVDIEAAMAELEAAHAGRREVKARIRRFLATRRLTSAAWTVEGCAVGCCRRDPSAPVSLRRLVVRPPRSAASAPILCFAGPPGGGKTSLAKLIGGALGRPAVTVALGGVWDETAIRGLSITFRTPARGRVVDALLEAGVRNPVIILDEIDKVGGRTHSHGDPSAALLEVLDPTQNTRFRDAYLDVPFDLSEVLFIATANNLAAVPPPLRDRLEVIAAPGYSEEEKVDIARRALWPDQLEAAGLTATGFWTRPPTAAHRAGREATPGAASVRRLAVEVLAGETAAAPGPEAGPAMDPLTAGPVRITDAAVLEVVRGHTCEAGVRELARQLGAICQLVACRRVETGDTGPLTVVADADEADGLEPGRGHVTVAETLGPARYAGLLPDGVRDALSRERDRVLGLHPADPAAVDAATWVEVIEGLPWRRQSGERLGAPAVLREVLDREHVGRGREKDQALDYLTARHAGEPTVLCLAGPAGIGKTAFARALAAAVGRRFVRVSLGGVKSPAGIHGVARPAPDAGPGRLVDALRRLGPLPGRAGDNPLVLLGELDRVDETAADALLAVLDPVRHRAFLDRYVGLPLDLTGVLFVAAAADPGRIPPLLIERLEVLPLTGHTDAEKQRIAARHLIPQRLARHGLSADELTFSPSALRLLYERYAREPGVCALDDRIDTVCRRAARLKADGVPRLGEMGPERLARWLGAPRFRDEESTRQTGRAGVALGLATTREGGDVLVVEAARLPGSGQLRVTGTVGAMMTESANVALTWVRSNAPRLAGVDAGFDEGADVHVHLAEASRGKDGPSAGVTLAVAVVSALSGQPVRGDVAMTGELTLAGRVEPVAGIREKVLAASRSGMTAVLLPAANAPDVVDSFGDELPGGITARYATTMDDVLEVMLPDVVA